MIHSLRRSLRLPIWTSLGLMVSAYNECLLGFGLQGLNPFESTDWVGLPICGESLAAAEVVTNWCTTSWTYSCFWSVVVGCTEDDDASCTCQACGGMPPDLDEYMLELPLWDRARCAVYALEEAGYDVTPCVEAIVDSMSMPGVIDSWTAPDIEQDECIAISYGSYYTDVACSYAGTPRFATEVFDDDAEEDEAEDEAEEDDDEDLDEYDDADDTATPAPAPVVSEAPTPAEDERPTTAPLDVSETVDPEGDATTTTPASPSSTETTPSTGGEEVVATGPDEDVATASPAPIGGTVEAEPTAGTDTSGDDAATNDIVIGVATTVVSAVILGVAKKMLSNRSSLAD